MWIVMLGVLATVGGLREEDLRERKVLRWPNRSRIELPTKPKEATVLVNGCCGLGHRTSRLMKAYTYSLSRRRQVVVNWGACVGTSVKNMYRELFSDLPFELIGLNEKSRFHSTKCPNNDTCITRAEWESYTDPKKMNSPEATTPTDLIINNDPPIQWYPPYSRLGQRLGKSMYQTLLPGIAKEWHLEFLDKDVAPYASRFAALSILNLKPRWRTQLEAFVHMYFSHQPVISVHFRIGNGESFSRKPQNITALILYTASAIRQMTTFFGYHRAFKVFIATDDQQVFSLFQELAPDLSTLSRPQWRPPAGAGIAFSSWALRPDYVQDSQALHEVKQAMTHSTDSCLSNSADMLLDALLLGYADAMLLTVPSTFSVLPKAIAFARHAPFCAFLHGTSPKNNKNPSQHIPLTCFRQARGHLTTVHLDVPRGGDADFQQYTQHNGAPPHHAQKLKPAADPFGYDASKPQAIFVSPEHNHHAPSSQYRTTGHRRTVFS